MAIVERPRKRFTTYYSVVPWHGKQDWKNCGHDRRKAERLDAAREKAVKAGTFHPDVGEANVFTLRQWFESWFPTRTNTSKTDEGRWIRRHVLRRERYADMKLTDWTPPITDALVRELQTQPRSEKDPRPLTDKSIANVIGVLHIMFADAKRAEHVQTNPIDLKPKTLNREAQQKKEMYSPGELAVLIRHHTIPEGIRVLNALVLLTGMREGEACGRRWRDLDDGTVPLWALDVSTQYGDKPLKTRRPRVVPLHPALREVLEAWGRNGFELLTCRKPTPDDFIVPLVTARAKTPHHTRSTYYKAFIRSCHSSGIRPRSLHSTRHTFISLARRAGAPKDVVEKITHNAKGDIIDGYTHLDWQPLCDAVLKVRLEVDEHQRLQLPPGNGGKRSGPAFLLEIANARELPPKTVTAQVSIPGASTLIEDKNRGFVKRVNFGVNALESYNGVGAARERAAGWGRSPVEPRPRRDAFFGEASA